MNVIFGAPGFAVLGFLGRNVIFGAGIETYNSRAVNVIFAGVGAENVGCVVNVILGAGSSAIAYYPAV